MGILHCQTICGREFCPRCNTGRNQCACLSGLLRRITSVTTRFSAASPSPSQCFLLKNQVVACGTHKVTSHLSTDPNRLDGVADAEGRGPELRHSGKLAHPPFQQFPFCAERKGSFPIFGRNPHRFSLRGRTSFLVLSHSVQVSTSNSVCMSAVRFNILGTRK